MAGDREKREEEGEKEIARIIWKKKCLRGVGSRGTLSKGYLTAGETPVSGLSERFRRARPCEISIDDRSCLPSRCVRSNYIECNLFSIAIPAMKRILRNSLNLRDRKRTILNIALEHQMVITLTSLLCMTKMNSCEGDVRITRIVVYLRIRFLPNCLSIIINYRLISVAVYPTRKHVARAGKYTKSNVLAQKSNDFWILLSLSLLYVHHNVASFGGGGRRRTRIARVDAVKYRFALMRVPGTASSPSARFTFSGRLHSRR